MKQALSRVTLGLAAFIVACTTAATELNNETSIKRELLNFGQQIQKKLPILVPFGLASGL